MTVSKDEFKKLLIELLRTDGDLRAEVYSIVIEAFPTKKEMEAVVAEIRSLTEKIAKQTETLQKNAEETAKRTNQFEKSLELLTKRMDSFEKSLELLTKRMDSFEVEMKKLREDMTRRMDSFEKSLELLTKRMDSFEVEMKRSREEFRLLVIGLGARWGFASEEAFREGIRGILEEMGYVVEKWEVYDDKGVIFARPAVIEVDVLVRDKKHMLIEIKSSVSRGDIATFIRKAEFYEKHTGVKPSLAIVTPYIYPDAKEDALKNEIRVYTRARDFKPI
ncbi:MAG: PD-(D/E)XK nuclease family protein [Candidatus Freyarchaeota archaeon]